MVIDGCANPVRFPVTSSGFADRSLKALPCGVRFLQRIKKIFTVFTPSEKSEISSYPMGLSILRHNIEFNRTDIPRYIITIKFILKLLNNDSKR